MEEHLQQFIQENPREIMALLEMVMQMNEEQLRQFVEALQQLAQQQPASGEGNGARDGRGAGTVQAQAEQEMSNQNLFG